MDGAALELAAANGEVEFVPLQQNAGLGGSAVRLIVQTGRESLHRLLWLHCAIAMHIGHVVCGTEQMVGIDETVTAVGDAVGTAGLVMEVSSFADIVAIAIRIW